MKIKIYECKTNGRTWTGRTQESIIRRVWGRRASLHIDNGISHSGCIYGQVVEPCKTGGLNCITDRVGIRKI